MKKILIRIFCQFKYTNIHRQNSIFQIYFVKFKFQIMSSNNMSSLRPNNSPQPDSPRPNSPHDNCNTLCTPLHHNSSTFLSSFTSPQSPTSPHTPLYHNSSTSPQTSTPR